MDNFADIESRYQVHYLEAARIGRTAWRQHVLMPRRTRRERLALTVIALALRLAPSLRALPLVAAPATPRDDLGTLPRFPLSS